MLSACASINRGMEAVLAAERAADREMMVRVAKQEQQSRHQHAALEAAGGRLESQSAALRRQQAAVAHLVTALSGPDGLQNRLADMRGALQRIAAELAMIEGETRPGTESSAGRAPAARVPGRPGEEAPGEAGAVPARR